MGHCVVKAMQNRHFDILQCFVSTHLHPKRFSAYVYMCISVAIEIYVHMINARQAQILLCVAL